MKIFRWSFANMFKQPVGERKVDSWVWTDRGWEQTDTAQGNPVEIAPPRSLENWIREHGIEASAAAFTASLQDDMTITPAMGVLALRLASSGVVSLEQVLDCRMIEATRDDLGGVWWWALTSPHATYQGQHDKVLHWAAAAFMEAGHPGWGERISAVKEWLDGTFEIGYQDKADYQAGLDGVNWVMGRKKLKEERMS